jgi:opacity protein-like surface antigen
MGRTKALWVCWCLAGAVPFAATAHAGGLPPLPPAPELEPDEPELRGSLADDGAYYLRLDAGVAFTNASGLRSTYGYGGALHGPVSLADPAILGVGAGYQFNPWLHADITGEYRPEVAYHARSTSAGDGYSGTVRSGLVLANAYVDFGDWFGFTPYAGAGLGAAIWQTSGAGYHSLPPGGAVGFAPDASGTRFAWDLTAGVAYHLLPNLLIDVSYRYVNMGSFRTGTMVCTPLPACQFGSQSFNVASNDLRVGLRWLANAPPTPPSVAARY